MIEVGSGGSSATHNAFDAQLTRWEQGDEPVPPSIDRLIRLSTIALVDDLKPYLASVVAQFPKVTNEPAGDNWEFHIDFASLAPPAVESQQAA